MLCAKCGGKLKVRESMQNSYVPNTVEITRIRVCRKCARETMSMEVIKNACIEKDYKHGYNLRRKVEKDEEDNEHNQSNNP